MTKVTTAQMTRADKVAAAAGPANPIQEGDTIDAEMEVTSIREKPGRYGPSWSVVCKPDPTQKMGFWFRRTLKAQNEAPVKEGDKLGIVATVSGIGTDGKMVFMKDVTIKGLTCTHKFLSLNGSGYKCNSCGSPFKGSV